MAGAAFRPVDRVMRHACAARVTVVSRVGCHLCDVAIDTVRATLGVEEITVLDVDGDLGEFAARRAEWSELVPVVLIDGAVHDVIRVDPDRLLATLFPPAPRGFRRGARRATGGREPTHGR